MRVRFWRLQLLPIIALTIAVSIFSQASLQTGYAVVDGTPGQPLPVGSALLRYTNADGVLVSETGVGFTELLRSGRVFVDEAGTQTTVAMVNPSLATANAVLVLRDQSGKEIARRNQTLKPGESLARYVRELFISSPGNLMGSLTVASDQPLGMLTLRESRNARGEPIYTALPVIDLSSTPASGSLVFPHIAVGGGYATQLVLINRTDQTVRGQIRLVGSDGRPLMARSSGDTVSEIAYEIAADGVFKVELLGVTNLAVGYALVTPQAGSISPAGASIFRILDKGALVTEAGVLAPSLTKASNIFVDQVGTRTGIALANPDSQPAVVTLSLMDRTTAPKATRTVMLPAGTHQPIFADELFSIMDGFTGVLEVRSSVPIALAALKVTVNTRNDLVLTTLPAADLTQTTSVNTLVLPHLALGSGFSTRLIFLNPDVNSASAGSISFFGSDGSPWTVPMSGQNSNRFLYRIEAGAGHQFLPGNTARVGAVEVIDPASGTATTEIPITQGTTVHLQLRITDTTGALRDDFDTVLNSVDPNIATVNPDGSIYGERLGFSTVTVTAPGYFSQITVNVVTVNSGGGAFGANGIAQDLSRRLYLTDTQDHTLFLAQTLNETPVVYAGIPRSPGLKNDLRLESQFHNPAFLALNHVDGSLYVADSANHVIRRVRPGTDGRVETLAGTGEASSQDGPAQSANFNNPQGIALDEAGNLWVADTGNHTIRRINLHTRMVETIAGLAGSSGRADGSRNQARFNFPSGIAVETEPIAQQLDRIRNGGPPPPPRVLVADTGNGRIRRVYSDGRVETLVVSSNTAAAVAVGWKELFTATVPATFVSPTGVVSDAFGNVYVTESVSGQIKTLLSNGQLVAAAPPGTLKNPRGLAITQEGQILVADSAGQTKSVQQINYGAPEIVSVLPQRVSTRGATNVTVHGRNFSPESEIVIGPVVVSNPAVKDTQTISFTVPSGIPSGLTTLTVQNRGGLAQTFLAVDPIPVDELLPGQITTVVGGTTFGGDGSAATAAALASPGQLALDTRGNLYIADQNNNRVRKVDAIAGVITTVAGSGLYGYSGDGGLATAASFRSPDGVAVDQAGNLYIADSGNSRIRKVDQLTGTITTIAGETPGFFGDGVPALTARFNAPEALAIDHQGNLYIADTANHRVRKIDIKGIITTVAGTGQPGFSQDGIPAREAMLNAPEGVAIDSSDNLVIADTFNHRIRTVSSDGRITTIAGRGRAGFSGDGQQALEADLDSPGGVYVSTTGQIVFADSGNHRIRRIDAFGIISTVAGSVAGSSGDGGPAIDARLNQPSSVIAVGNGTFFIADRRNNRVRKVQNDSGRNLPPFGSQVVSVISTFAGSGQPKYLGDNGPAGASSLRSPFGVAIDGAGNLFIADSSNNRIRRVNANTGVIQTIAGTGTAGYSGDEQSANVAMLNRPQGMAIDSAGNLFIADTGNNRIRKIDSSGTITTFAGNGRAEFSGDHGPAGAAGLAGPSGIAFDNADNLFIADTGNHRIRRVDAATLTITSVAGNGTPGFSGDGELADIASMNSPVSVKVDTAGNLFVVDFQNVRIRRVDAQSGHISTIAGVGRGTYGGDDGPAKDAGLNYPFDLEIATDGTLYVADSSNNRIRRVTTDGLITTIAGTGEAGFSGDGSAARAARLFLPVALRLDTRGNLFFVEAANERVRALKLP